MTRSVGRLQTAGKNRRATTGRARGENNKYYWKGSVKYEYFRVCSGLYHPKETPTKVRYVLCPSVFPSLPFRVVREGRTDEGGSFFFFEKEN